MSVRSLQRALDAAPDRLGAAVEAGRRAGLEIESELGRDHDLVAHGLERFADELFVRERPVDLRGVEEGDATFDCGAGEGDHLPAVGNRQVALAHAHAAEADRRYFQGSEGARLHDSS